jgi:hypothetical protein
MTEPCLHTWKVLTGFAVTSATLTPASTSMCLCWCTKCGTIQLMPVRNGV